MYLQYFIFVGLNSVIGLGSLGIDGNKEADELARRASAISLIGPEPFCCSRVRL